MAIDAPIPAMAPVVPTLAPGASATALIAPSSTDRWAALKAVGWWKPIDWLMLIALGGHLLVAVLYSVVHAVTMLGFIMGMLNCCLILLGWIVILVYRCMDFVLQMRASIELLPLDAARLAVSYMSGGQSKQ